MRLNNRLILEQWYFDNYSSKKGFNPTTANRMATRYAETVIDAKTGKESEGAMGNVRGILGEVLAVAALDIVTAKPYHHELSTVEEDNKGIDVNALNGVPYPLLSFGVKLQKGGRAHTIIKRPVINIRISQEAFFIDELIETQGRGMIMEPHKFVEGVFCQPANRVAFLEVLNRQFSAAFDIGVIRPDTLAEAYSTQFL